MSKIIKNARFIKNIKKYNSQKAGNLLKNKITLDLPLQSSPPKPTIFLEPDQIIFDLFVTEIEQGFLNQPEKNFDEQFQIKIDGQ